MPNNRQIYNGFFLNWLSESSFTIANNHIIRNIVKILVFELIYIL